MITDIGISNSFHKLFETEINHGVAWMKSDNRIKRTIASDICDRVYIHVKIMVINIIGACEIKMLNIHTDADRIQKELKYGGKDLHFITVVKNDI